MSEEIIKILDDLGKRLGVAIDWSNQNIIPYLQELMGRFIAFRNVQTIIWISIFLIVTGLSIFGLVKLIKWRKSDKYDKGFCSDDPFVFWMSIAGIVCVLLVASVVIICNTFGICQNIFLPEITVIDYIQAYL